MRAFLVNGVEGTSEVAHGDPSTSNELPAPFGISDRVATLTKLAIISSGYQPITWSMK